MNVMREQCVINNGMPQLVPSTVHGHMYYRVRTVYIYIYIFFLLKNRHPVITLNESVNNIYINNMKSSVHMKSKPRARGMKT